MNTIIKALLTALAIGAGILMICIGSMFILLGFLFCLTLIGAIIGIPIMTFGATIFVSGALMLGIPIAALTWIRVKKDVKNK